MRLAYSFGVKKTVFEYELHANKIGGDGDRRVKTAAS